MGAVKSKRKIPQQKSRNITTNVTYEDTCEFIPKINECTVVKVYDGDTITIATTVGDTDPTIYRFNVRLAGIDCPEMRPADKNSDEKEIAILARDFTLRMLLGKQVELIDISYEKYGRLLATVHYRGMNINQMLLDKRLAIVYDNNKMTYPKSWKRYNETGSFD